MADIKEYYSANVKREWERLTQDPYHKLEFETTLHFLKKHLPKKGLVLDAGGGPGRYTVELAKQGYEVVLSDIAKANLEFAKRQITDSKLQNKVKDVVEGSIVDLSEFAHNTFDAVICLGGPLSHVEGDENRNKAVTELIRVAKKHAPIFVSVFGKFGGLILDLYGSTDKISAAGFKRFVSTGEDYSWRKKYYAHYFTSEELQSLFTQNGCKIVALAGLEGLGTPLPEAINKLAKNEKAYRNWLKAHYKLCTYPVVAGLSIHMLIVAKKI